MMKSICRARLVWLLVLGSPLAAHAGTDVNTATVEQLEQLTGVGPAKADAIVAHRDAHGPFTSLQQLTAIDGIGPATLEALRGQIDLVEDPDAPPAPSASAVDINQATEEELAALPGVGIAKAHSIVQNRETHGRFRSCADLERVPGIGPATVWAIADRCDVKRERRE